MQVLDAARAVILASGTLSPLGSLTRQLFPAPTKPLHAFSCGHVVPASSMLALPLGTGPKGVALDLRHAARSTAHVLDELLGLLLGGCKVTPQVQAGAYVFSCGHVVPASSMLALLLGTGPSGVALDLRHASRSTARVLDELLGLLLGVRMATPQVQAQIYAFGECGARKQHAGPAAGDWPHWSGTGPLARCQEHCTCAG